MVQPKSNRLLVESQIGAPNGVAGLGLDAKIPDAQLPRGVANGLATLGADAKVPDVQLPGWILRAFNVPDPVADAAVNRANIQAQVNAAAAAGGGTVILQRGEYLVGGTITLPNEVFVWLRGAGMGQVGNTYGTRIRRSYGDTPLIQALGTLASRPKFTISDMAINGGGGTTVLNLSRVSGSALRNLFVSGAAGSLLIAEEWWNSALTNVSFMSGGTGRAIPAVWFKAPAATPSDPGNTIQMTGVLWEGNNGTDLKLSGAEDGVLAVLASNIKMERNGGNFPLIELEKAGACQFSDGFLHLGPDATAPHIEQKGATVPSRPNGFSNFEISGSKWTTGNVEGGQAVVPYFVDLTAGELLLSNVSMNGNPTTAFIHAGPTVGLTALRQSNVPVSNPAKRLHDERPSSVANFGSVDVPARYVYTGANPVPPSLVVDQVVYKMPQSVQTDYIGHVTIPADAVPGRPIRVRVLWYSPAAAGNVRLEVKAKAGLQGGSTTLANASELQAQVVAIAGANVMHSTTFTFAATASPGQTVPVRVTRNGADATDTLTTNDIRIYQVELRYERAF